MKCFLILEFVAGNPKTVFKVVDRTFYCDFDFIYSIPFFSSAYISATIIGKIWGL